MKLKKKNISSKVIVYIILVFYAMLTFVPFIWAIITSFKTTAEISAANTILPNVWTFEAYEKILTPDFVRAVGSSLFVAITATILNVIFNTAAGYALARLKFKGRKFIFKALMLLIMIPMQVTMIPAYIVISKLGLVNTHVSLIFTSAVNISYIFLMKQFFTDFPKDVEESAALDGLSKFQLFTRIVLPMAKPAIATQAIFTFMGVWNDFMKPLLYIQTPDKYVLTQFLNNVAKQQIKASAWNITMAGSILSIIPILIIFIVLNKYFVTLNDQNAGSK